MKRVEVVKNAEVEVKPFILNDFMQTVSASTACKALSKKEIKHLAKELGLDPKEEELAFAKKIMNAYAAKEGKLK